MKKNGTLEFGLKKTVDAQAEKRRKRIRNIVMLMLASPLLLLVLIFVIWNYCWSAYYFKPDGSPHDFESYGLYLTEKACLESARALPADFAGTPGLELDIVCGRGCFFENEALECR